MQEFNHVKAASPNAPPESSPSPSPHPSLDEFLNCARESREITLGNLVMIGEIPSPTFQEAHRVNEFVHRLIESGVENCSVDNVGNGIGIIAGSTGDQNILLAASADSIHDNDFDHAISVSPDKISGCGISDSLGISVLATLPILLDRLGLKLRSNLILLAAARSAGRGNLEGIRYFLQHARNPIHLGICLKGAPLGRLSYTSLGMLRGDITCKVPPEYDWTRYGAAGAVMTINKIISQIAAIPLPRQPATNIVLGSLEAGTTYDRIARKAVLKFEIRSEDPNQVQQISEDIADIVAETESKSGAEIALDIFARRAPGGIQINHPLVRRSRDILTQLGIPPRIMPSTSETSALIDQNIPSVTLGLTHGESLSDRQETLEITPMFQGIAQLLGLIAAVDGGLAP